MSKLCALLAGLAVCLVHIVQPFTAFAAPQALVNLPICNQRQFRITRGVFFSSNFTQDETVFAVAVFPGEVGWRLYRSIDGGATWTLSSDENIYTLTFSPAYATDRMVFAVPYSAKSQEQGYFLRSKDGGATWEQMNTPKDGPFPGGFSALAVVDSQTIYYSASAEPGSANPLVRGLFRFSFDAEDITWEQLTFRNVNAITLSPDFQHDHTLWIGEYGYKVNYGLSKSTDGGRTWGESSQGIDLTVTLGGDDVTEALFAPDYPSSRLMFAVTDYHYYRSTDDGAHWQSVWKLPGWKENPALAWPHWVLSPNFAHDHRAWIEGGTWMTTDAGVTWRPTGGAEMMNLAARKRCEDNRCGILLLGSGASAGSGEGVYKSFDLGRTWQCPDAFAPAWWPNPPSPVSVWLPMFLR